MRGLLDLRVVTSRSLLDSAIRRQSWPNGPGRYTAPKRSPPSTTHPPLSCTAQRAAIDRVLDQPGWIDAIRSRLRIGQSIDYFDPQANRPHARQILKLRRKQAVVLDFATQKRWLISYAAINLDGADVEIREDRYIQLFEKTDYVLRALDALFLDEVITMEEYNVRRGLFKGYVKRFYYACRSLDEGLRARMDALELKDKARAASKDSSPASAEPNASNVSRPVNESSAKRSKAAKTKPKSAQAVV